MKTIFINILFLILLFFSSTGFKNEQKTLLIEDKSRKINLDEVKGEDVLVSFILENIGNNTINIENVQPHCGCTDFEITNWIIAPGGKVELKLRTSKESLKNLKRLYAVITTNTNTKYYKVQFYL